jgi:hypothetical protein
MNATELFHQDGRTAGVFYCAECRHVAKTREQADGCCAPYKCTRCGCDVDRKTYRTVCPPCEEAKRREKEAARFAAAEKVTEWDGWIYCEEVSGYNDHYFVNVGELEDYIASEIPDEVEMALLSEEEQAEVIRMPAYVWTCTANAFAAASLDQITEQIADNAYEDFDCADLRGLDALQAAVDAFNEANAGILCYSPNYKRALILSKSNTSDNPTR